MTFTPDKEHPMKPHTYSFTYIGCAGTRQHGEIEATSRESAYKATMADTRLKGCTILSGSFRRTDTAKGANRAGGLDSNGKQLDCRHFKDGNLLNGKSPSECITAYQKAKEATCKEVKDRIEARAYKNFLKHLDLAIENLYLCHFESNGAVLSMPIKELYETMKEYDPFK